MFGWLKQKAEIPAGMADLHNHVLPGVDDGATTMEASLAMLRDFADSGFSAVSVSCHLGHPRFPEVTASLIQEQTARVNEELEKEGIEIALWPGAEIFCDDQLMTRLEQGELLSIGGDSSYYLIEFSLRDPMLRMKEIAFTLSMQGIRPILAHPERYDAIQRHPEHIFVWREAGWIMQLDLCSLLNDDSRQIRKMAQHFLRQGVCDLAASDLHGPTGRVRQMVEALACEVDADEIERLMVTNPHRILQNQPIVQPELDEER